MIGRGEEMTENKVEEEEMRQIKEEKDHLIDILQNLQTDLKEVEVLQEMVPEEVIEVPQKTGETNQETDMKEIEIVPEVDVKMGKEMKPEVDVMTEEVVPGIKEMIEDQLAGIHKIEDNLEEMTEEDHNQEIHPDPLVVKGEKEIEMGKGIILPIEATIKDQETMVEENNHLHQEEIKMEGVIQEKSRESALFVHFGSQNNRVHSTPSPRDQVQRLLQIPQRKLLQTKVFTGLLYQKVG